jgi:hypothetical protein
MILHSAWRWPEPLPVALEKLTPSVVHENFRHRQKTTPSITSQGLWYPVCCVKITRDYWERFVVGNYTDVYKKHLLPAVVNQEDNQVWMIKVGCNRFFSARELGYSAIDCVFFSDPSDAVRMARWYQQCDPVNNQNCQPYSGKFDYI